MADEPANPETPPSTPKSPRRKKTDKPKPVAAEGSKSKRRRPATGDRYDLSGDFRGAVINIKSTIVSSADVKDIENLPPEPGEPPFQGLQYYDEKDADRFFGRETLIATRRPGMAIWREKLFAFLSRNAQPATSFFGIPPDRVMEVGTQIEL